MESYEPQKTDDWKCITGTKTNYWNIKKKAILKKSLQIKEILALWHYWQTNKSVSFSYTLTSEFHLKRSRITHLHLLVQEHKTIFF